MNALVSIVNRELPFLPALCVSSSRFSFHRKQVIQHGTLPDVLPSRAVSSSRTSRYSPSMATRVGSYTGTSRGFGGQFC